MPSVFISHSSLDKPFVRRLTLDLRKSEIEVWLDEEQIEPGQSIVGRINDGLIQKDFVLLAVSANFLSSEWATWETNSSIVTAVNKKANSVIPLLIDNCWDSAPPLLADKSYIDFRLHGNIVEYRQSLGRLIAVLSGVKSPPKLKTHTPTVMVTGGRDPKFNSKAFLFAYEFGLLVGASKYPAMCGTAYGVDEHFARGVSESLKNQSKDPHDFLTCYFGRGRSANHSFGTQLESAYAKREEGVPELVTEADIIVLFGGSKNTQNVGIMALLENKVVLPVAATSGAAKDVHNIIRSRYDKTFFANLPKSHFLSLANTNCSPSDMAKKCISIVNGFIA